MTQPLAEDINAAWETESGLVDDVDGYITNPRFGTKEEYAQAVVETTGQAGGTSGLMFIVDLADPSGEIIGGQGWSVGSGWEPSADGLHISHPKRSNVVGSSLYGQLQTKVVRDLGVSMGEHGNPLDALSWDRLGFHWMQVPHPTVGGKEATGLMPTMFLGKAGAVPGVAPTPTPGTPAPGAPAPPPPGTPSPAMIAALTLVSECADVKAFQLKVVINSDIVADDALMASCLNDSPEGFFAKYKS